MRSDKTVFFLASILNTFYFSSTCSTIRRSSGCIFNYFKHGDIKGSTLYTLHKAQYRICNKYVVCNRYVMNKHYATNRQVAGSIPDGVIGIFQCHNPSGRTMTLGSTQSLTEMSTRCISWG